MGFNVHENFKINFGLRFSAAVRDAENKDDDYWDLWEVSYSGGSYARTAITRNVTGGLELAFVYVLPMR